MGKIFKRGMIAVAPLALTLVLILWLFNTLEALFKPPVEAVIGKSHYFTGLGIIVAFNFSIVTFIKKFIYKETDESDEEEEIEAENNSIGEAIVVDNKEEEKNSNKTEFVSVVISNSGIVLRHRWRPGQLSGGG